MEKVKPYTRQEWEELEKEMHGPNPPPATTDVVLRLLATVKQIDEQIRDIYARL